MKFNSRIVLSGRARDLLVFVALSAGLISFDNRPAYAQLPQDLGPAAQPDVRGRDRDNRPRRSEGPTIEIPRTAPTRPPAGADQIVFVLNDLQIEGATAYTSQQLRETYGRFLNTEVRLTDLYEIAAAIQTRYRDDGYFLSRVFVPEQRSRGGVFTLRVVEGYISEVEIGGIDHPSNGLVRRYLNQVRNERPLRLSTLEHYLLLANDVPGLAVSVLLRRAPDLVGAAILAVRIKLDEGGGYLSVDNLGSRFTGLLTTSGGVFYQGQTKYGERLALNGVVRDKPWEPGEWVLQGSGSVLVGDKGTSVGVTASYGRSSPDTDNLSAVVTDFEGTAYLVSASVTHPFKRSRDLSIWGTLALDVFRSASDFETIGGFMGGTEDNLRVLSAAGRVEWLDRFAGRGSATVAVRRGLPIFGHTDSEETGASRVGATGVFTTVGTQISRLQQVSNTVSVLTELSGQIAFDDVLSPEEFTLGGRRHGRGYGQADFAGDHGVGATVEVQYSRLTDILPLLEGYQAFTFMDYGVVWDRSEANATVDPLSGQSSVDFGSVGAGVRAAMEQDVTLEFQVVKPVFRDTLRRTVGGSQTTGNRDVQLLFELGKQF